MSLVARFPIDTSAAARMTHRPVAEKPAAEVIGFNHRWVVEWGTISSGSAILGPVVTDTVRRAMAEGDDWNTQIINEFRPTRAGSAVVRGRTDGACTPRRPQIG